MPDVYVDGRPLPVAHVPTYLGVKWIVISRIIITWKVWKWKLLAVLIWSENWLEQHGSRLCHVAYICPSISVFNCWILRPYVVPQFQHSHAGLWIESCHAHHNRLPQKYVYSHAICPGKCCLNTQRCSRLEICLESSCRPTELATWHSNCSTSRELSAAAVSNQIISQIKLGLLVVEQRLASRKPFQRKAQTLLANYGEDCLISANQRKTLADIFVLDSWKRSWRESYAWRDYFHTPQLAPLKGTLRRTAWSRFNRLLSGRTRLAADTYRYGIVASPVCDCVWCPVANPGAHHDHRDLPSQVSRDRAS